MRTCATLLASAAICAAQLSSTISLNNGLRLDVSANLGQPTGQQTLTTEMTRASGNSFYRIFWDQNHLAVYAYELQLDLSPNGNSLLVTAKPADDVFAARFPQADAGKPVPTLSEDRRLDPLASGQSATLDFFEIPGMGIHLTDTIHVQFGQQSSGALRFDGLRVVIGGKGAAGPAPGSVAGRYAMFYLPGRGGFFFSTEPAPGFVKLGVIDGNHMRFTVDNVDYECTSSSPIRAQRADLWVRHDPSYQPAGNWTRARDDLDREQFFTAASDSLGWWLP